MHVQRHGISIGMERAGNTLFLSMKAIGKLTHADYQSFLPMLEGALGEVREPRVRALFDATEFEGWEVRAAWDDLRFGLRHGNDFERIAIVGQAKWQAVAAKVAGWFTSGEVRHFEDFGEALDWLGG